MSEENYLIEIGRKIREKRKEKRMSQDEVAALCDIEKANLSRIENGKTNSTILTLRKISLVLFNHTSELFLD
ncbi:MAG: hypothetical protein RLZZ367_1568 [Bacteroidota bacterium]|jgi:transcriptional regulator with XRE-family HTH domain